MPTICDRSSAGIVLVAGRPPWLIGGGPTSAVAREKLSNCPKNRRVASSEAQSRATKDEEIDGFDHGACRSRIACKVLERSQSLRELLVSQQREAAIGAVGDLLGEKAPGSCDLAVD